MRVTGKILSLVQDFATGKYNLLVAVNEAYAIKNQFDNVKDLDVLDIQITKHSEKRSLNSNAYCWVLLQKIAEAVNSTKEDVYIQMIERYGQFSHLVAKEKAIQKLGNDFPLVKNLGEITVGSTKGIQLQVYFGSSTYSQDEMNFFLNGIVDEARRIGIETLTPAELEQMNRSWNK